jgi:hypothetical protein
MNYDPDLHGGIPVWLAEKNGGFLPALDGYFHFFTLLGIRQWEEGRGS